MVKLALGLSAIWLAAAVLASEAGSMEMLWAGLLPGGLLLGIVWLMS